MAVDIQLHAEVKINGVWHHYGHYHPLRVPEVFRLLGGLGEDDSTIVCPIAERRGIPDDVTALTRFDYERGRGERAASWCDLLEIRQLREALITLYGRPRFAVESWLAGSTGEPAYAWLFGDEWEYPDMFVEATRWVFWFD